jgi:hypothetical protein
MKKKAKAKGKVKAGRKRSAVKDLAAKKAVKGGLLPAVRPGVSNTGISNTGLGNTGLRLPAVQKGADGSV